MIVSVSTIPSCEIASVKKLKVLNSLPSVVFLRKTILQIFHAISCLLHALCPKKRRLKLNRDCLYTNATMIFSLLPRLLLFLWKNFHEENFPAKRLSSLFDNQPLKSQRTDFQTNFKRQQTIFHFNLHRNNDDNYSRSCLFLFTLVSRRTSSFLAISWFPGCL